MIILKFNYDNFCNYCNIAKGKGKWISSKLIYTSLTSQCCQAILIVDVNCS